MVLLKPEFILPIFLFVVCLFNHFHTFTGSLVHVLARMTSSVGLCSIFASVMLYQENTNQSFFMEESEYQELGELAEKAKIATLA